MHEKGEIGKMHVRFFFWSHQQLYIYLYVSLISFHTEKALVPGNEALAPLGGS